MYERRVVSKLYTVDLSEDERTGLQALVKKGNLP